MYPVTYHPLEQMDHDERLALPAPDSQNTNPTVQLNGSSIGLDYLGPIIVQADGTLTRISNWSELSEGEKQTTLRVIAKRNKERLQRLQKLVDENTIKMADLD